MGCVCMCVCGKTKQKEKQPFLPNGWVLLDISFEKEYYFNGELRL